MRVTAHGNSYYLPTSITLEKKFWDSRSNKVLQKYPNAKLLNLAIAKKKLTIEEVLFSQDNVEELSIHELKLVLNRQDSRTSFNEFTRKLIGKLKKENKYGNAQVYEQTLSKLESHFGGTLSFNQVSYGLLCSLRDKMTTEGMSVNGMSVYFRTIRAIYNKAIEANLVDRSLYPFYRFKIRNEQTLVRALTMEELKAVAALKLEPGGAQWDARNYFLLSYSLIGMNLIDMCMLTSQNVQGDRINFKRQKTGKVYSVKLNNLSRQILEHYAQDGYYLLPLLSENKLPMSEVKRISKQSTKTLNKHLKRIGEELGLNVKLTTYVARHTWASTAKKLGYTNELIADAMGHSIGNSTTAIYLDRFENEKIDQLNLEVCKVVSHTLYKGVK